MTVQTLCEVLVVADPEARKGSPDNKSFLRLTFENGVTVDITTNLGEMIGGASIGVRKRREDGLSP